MNSTFSKSNFLKGARMSYKAVQINFHVVSGTLGLKEATRRNYKG
jgi:hypothetical protein